MEHCGQSEKLIVGGHVIVKSRIFSVACLNHQVWIGLPRCQVKLSFTIASSYQHHPIYMTSPGVFDEQGLCSNLCFVFAGATLMLGGVTDSNMWNEDVDQSMTRTRCGKPGRRGWVKKTWKRIALKDMLLNCSFWHLCACVRFDMVWHIDTNTALRTLSVKGGRMSTAVFSLIYAPPQHLQIFSSRYDDKWSNARKRSFKLYRLCAVKSSDPWVYSTLLTCLDMTHQTPKHLNSIHLHGAYRCFVLLCIVM